MPRVPPTAQPRRAPHQDAGHKHRRSGAGDACGLRSRRRRQAVHARKRQAGNRPPHESQRHRPRNQQISTQITIFRLRVGGGGRKRPQNMRLFSESVWSRYGAACRARALRRTDARDLCTIRDRKGKLRLGACSDKQKTTPKIFKHFQYLEWAKRCAISWINATIEHR